jgi:hypothetical protein
MAWNASDRRMGSSAPWARAVCVAQKQDVAEARRNLLQVMGHQDNGKLRPTLRERFQVFEQVFTGARIQTSTGLVENQQVRLSGQGAREPGSSPLTQRQFAEGTIPVVGQAPGFQLGTRLALLHPGRAIEAHSQGSDETGFHEFLRRDARFDQRLQAVAGKSDPRAQG